MKIKLDLGTVVKLSDEYYIESIPLCYVLKKSYVSYGNGSNKSAKPRLIEKEVGYYQTVQGAVERFIREVVRDKTDDFDGNLEEYCKRIENITSEAVEKIVGYIGNGRN